MFALLSIFKPKPAPEVRMLNAFNSYAVAMPAGLVPVLQSRVFSVILHRYYNVSASHGVSTEELIQLHNRLSDETADDAHNFLLDGYLLYALKLFLETERRLALRPHPKLNRGMKNDQYWILTGDLLESVIRPTQLVILSFCA